MVGVRVQHNVFAPIGERDRDDVDDRRDLVALEHRGERDARVRREARTR